VKIAQVRVQAKALGIKTSRRKKADVIRDIQRAEGNFPCFGTAVDHCNQTDCCWREACMPPPLEPKPRTKPKPKSKR